MLTVQTLIDDLASGCKPKDRWKIGLEVERFAFRSDNGRPLGYEGNSGVRALLEIMAQQDGWQVIEEAGNPIALSKNGMSISIEPGGQIEYSGAPLENLDAARAEMAGVYAALDRAAAALGVSFLAAGFHPNWTRADVHWMPKGRYRIMRPYMEKVGAMGVDMMARTCGAQVNLDFSSEKDMVQKFRVALGLQPVITALMANSRVVEGKDSGFASYRSQIWTDTDPARSGVLPFVYDDDMGFARYVEYALDVPMYFVYRDGAYIDVSGLSFRDFMAGKLRGFEGQYPSISDWRDHLSTLFPEVRLKYYLELRGPDSNQPPLVHAMAAFWAGLLYDEAALDGALSLIKGWTAAEHGRIRDSVPLKGLATMVPGGRTLALIAHEILPAAQRGLNSEERHYIEPLFERLELLGSISAGLGAVQSSVRS